MGSLAALGADTNATNSEGAEEQREESSYLDGDVLPIQDMMLMSTV